MNYEARFSDSELATMPVVDAGRRRVRRNRWIVAALAAIALAALAWFVFGREAAAPADDKPARAVPVVTVSTPGRQTVQRVISATGTLAARRELPVGAVGEGGLVTRVFVEPGDWVRQGQVLAAVDRQVQTQQNASLAAQIDVARADARMAQSELDRANQLVSRGFISTADVERRTATRDAARARVAVAAAQLSENRARTARLDIRAPKSGLILTRAVEPGQVVGAGTGVLFRMAEGGQMEMLARLGESDLAGLAVGVSAQVTPVGGSRSFGGQVWQISPVIDPESRQGAARIALSYDRALRPGGFAAARITTGAIDAPLLPESAVQSDERGNYVYIVGTDSRVVRRPVTIGEVSDAGVAIAAGLSGQERVVLSAGAFVKPGDEVKPSLVRSGR